MYRKSACLTILVLMVGLASNALAGPDPVGWWRFDEGSNSTAYDSSGSGNNGGLSLSQHLI